MSDHFRLQQIVELQGLLADANARLARVEALADRWDAIGHTDAHLLRAALAAAPLREGEA